jgi:hypothetical protein
MGGLNKSRSTLDVHHRKMVVEQLLRWHNRLPHGPLFDRRIEYFQSVGGFGIRAIGNILEPCQIIRVPLAGWHEFSADESVKEAKRCNPQFYQTVCNVSNTLIPNSVEHSDNLIKSSCLATKLILDRNTKYKRSPYIEFLYQATYPGTKSLLPHPLLMADDLGDPDGLLIGSNSRREILKRREMYHYIAESLFGKGNDMVPEFKWAMGIILSRAVSNTATGMPLTLVPVMDLVNHGNEGFNAEHNFDRKTREFSLSTTAVVFEGDEIFINYGEGRDTASFMSIYGFNGKGNQNDHLRFQLAPKNRKNSSSPHSEVNSVTEIKREESMSSVQGLDLTDNREAEGTTSSMDAVKPIKIFAEISLDFLHSLDKQESHNIINRLLRTDSETETETESRLQLCGEVVAAAHGALGDNLLNRARAVAETYSSAIDIDVSKTKCVVENEILSIRIILESVDKNISDMLPDDKKPPQDPSVVSNSSTSSKYFCVPSIIAIAESRLQHLQKAAVRTQEHMKSPSTLEKVVSKGILQWRYSCATISAHELDGLIRLRLFCTAYHIALLSSI